MKNFDENDPIESPRVNPKDPLLNLDAKQREMLLNGYKDSSVGWKEIWQINYESGTNYELYRVLLKKE